MRFLKMPSVNILIGIACFFALAFLGVSLNITSRLNHNLQSLTDYPFLISNTTHEIREIIDEHEIRINRILHYISPQNIDIVRNALQLTKSKLDNNINFILNNYTGPGEGPERLPLIIHQIEKAEEEFYSLSLEAGLEERQNFLDEQLTPLYRESENICLDILSSTQQTVETISSRSERTLKLSNVLFFALAILLIFICIILYIVTRIRTRDKARMDFVLASISDHTDNIFLIYDFKKKSYSYISQNVERILGLAPKVIEEVPFIILEYVQPAQKESIIKIFDNNFLVKKKVEREINFVNPVLHRSMWFNLVINPVTVADTITHYVITINDFTSIKTAQENLVSALMSAQKANRAKSEFLSRMSHEIRTPMNAIIGMCALAQINIDHKDKVIDCLDKIEQSSKHLLMIINDVLDMSKIESGNLSVFNKPFSISEIFSNIQTVIMPQIRAKKQNFKMFIPQFASEILIGDGLRLSQILLNILSNAIKYTPDEGTIQFEVTESQPENDRIRIRFTISDTGYGMSKEFQEHLFEPFIQEERSEINRAGSTGIGMAITKNLIQLMEGTIAVHSELNKGSTFVVEIPFLINAEIESVAYQYEQFQNVRVLILDSIQKDAELTYSMLEKMGFAVEISNSFDQALMLLKKNDYRFLFLDCCGWDFEQLNYFLGKFLEFRKPETLLILTIPTGASYYSEEFKDYHANYMLEKPLLSSNVYNGLSRLIQVKDSPSVKTSLESPPDLSGYRILLVEDNAVNSMIAQELIERTGAQVDSAFDGEEALTKFTEADPGHYQLILMDIQLPKMDGYHATMAIRKTDLPHAKDIPIIAMTADAFTDDIFMAAESGMNAHLSKPIDVNLFYKTLEEYLIKKPGESSAAKTV